MSEFVQEIRDFFTERLTNPLWVSFIFIWLIWNWEVPVTAIFEIQNFNVRYLQHYLDSSPWCFHTLIPFGLAFAYSISSKAIRDIVILLSRTISSVVGWFDRKYNTYNWIKRSEHDAVISRISRTNTISEAAAKNVQKLSEECENYRSENSKLARELAALKGDNESTHRTDTNTDNGNANANYIIDSSFEISPEVKARSSSDIYAEMINNLDEQQQAALKDPSSNACTLLTLHTLRSPTPKNKKPDVTRLAINPKIYTECLTTLLRAKLVKKNHNSDEYTITPAGEKLASDLAKDSSSSFIMDLFRNADSIAKDQIISLLESRHATLNTIAESIVFTPHLIAILNALTKEGRIQHIGGRYFKNRTEK